MQPNEETQDYYKIQQHYTKLKTIPTKLRETQLPALQTIMDHPQFDKIASAFEAIEKYFGSELKTADKSFVSLKLMEIEDNKEKDDLIMLRMEESIQKLREIIGSLDQQNTLICQKFKWLSQQIDKFESALPDIQEEIDIVHSQNQKLKSNPSKNTKASNSDGLQLKQLLAYYRCNDRPFPKNKTEVLMLVNRIESMIQQLQMKKLSKYL